MSTTWIIVIAVIAAIVVIAIALAVGARKRRLENRREQAAGLREEAQIRARSAKQAELAAEEQAERARRERKAAEEQSARADEIDPDAGDRDGDRNQQEMAAPEGRSR